MLMLMLMLLLLLLTQKGCRNEGVPRIPAKHAVHTTVHTRVACPR